MSDKIGAVFFERLAMGKGALKIDKIKSWKDRIVELLNRHLLITPEEDRLIVFGMNNGQGEVHFGLFKRFEGGEPIDPA